MGYQPESGRQVSREIFAEAAMPYYRFAMRGTDVSTVPLGVAPATARAAVIGVTVPSEEGYRPTSIAVDGFVGGIVPRTQYNTGEIPIIYEAGVVYVEMGTVSGTASPGVEVMSDADGKAVVYTLPVTSMTEAGATNAEIQAGLDTAAGENKVKAGKLIDPATTGDIVRIKLYGDD